MFYAVGVILSSRIGLKRAAQSRDDGAIKRASREGRYIKVIQKVKIFNY
jgi:hypothetical protein